MANSVWTLLEEISKKQGITEIIINRFDNIFVEHQGELVKLNAKVVPEDIEPFVQEVALQNQKKFSPEHPIMDGNLPDGSRINVISRDYAFGGPAITIRKYLKSIKMFNDNPTIFALSPRWLDFFESSHRW